MSDWRLFQSALRDIFGLRKAVVVGILVILPAAIGLIWRLAQHVGYQPELAYNTLCAELVFGFILVILAVVFGTGVVAQEVEQKTIVYLLTHPVPRWRILLVKFLAAFLAITVAAWIASLLLALVTFGPAHLGQSHLLRDLGILAVGALAYGALFLLLSTLVSRPLIYGLLFTFGWETWVPNLPGDFHKLSLMAYLRVLAPHPQPQSDTVDLSSLISSLNPSSISTSLAWDVLLAVVLICLLAAVLTFSRREYAPRDSE